MIESDVTQQDLQKVAEAVKEIATHYDGIFSAALREVASKIDVYNSTRKNY